MLALFRKFVRWLRRDGVRAPEKLVAPEFQPLEIEGRWLIVRIPIPPEDVLMDMLYQNREHAKPLGILFDVSFDGDFVEDILSAQRAATPGPRETTKPER